MKQNFMLPGSSTDISYFVNELCHSARQSNEAAHMLGFKNRNCVYYAANALKRLKKSDELQRFSKNPSQGDIVNFDTRFMLELSEMSHGDITCTEVDPEHYALGELLTRLAHVSRTSLKTMIRLPHAHFNAVRSRFINWSTPVLARALKQIGADWSIINLNPMLLDMLKDLARKDLEFEQKVQLLSRIKASQQNICLILNIQRRELSVFNDYYNVDAYTPTGRTAKLTDNELDSVYYSAVKTLRVNGDNHTRRDAIQQLVKICTASGCEARSVLLGIPELLRYEACPSVHNLLCQFLSELNIVVDPDPEEGDEDVYH